TPSASPRRLRPKICRSLSTLVGVSMICIVRVPHHTGRQFRSLCKPWATTMLLGSQPVRSTPKELSASRRPCEINTTPRQHGHIHGCDHCRTWFLQSEWRCRGCRRPQPGGAFAVSGRTQKRHPEKCSCSVDFAPFLKLSLRQLALISNPDS